MTSKRLLGMKGDDRLVYTISQVAKRWGCCRQTVRDEMKKGKLKYFTFGSEKYPKYRIREDWLLEYEEEQARKNQKEVMNEG